MSLIPKYFVGGVSVNIPMGYPTIQALYERKTAGGDSGDSSESGSKKTIIEQIFDPKAKMLASDAVKMAELALEAGRLEANSAFAGYSKPLQYAAIYSKYITYANMAANNYESLKEAKSELISKGAAKEAAITSEGLLFVHKNGEEEISLIDPRNFIPGKDISVTNAELTYLRANDPRFAYNDKLLATISGATSMKEIREIIKDATSKLESESSENQFFVNPLADRDLTALQALANAHITDEDLKTMDLGTLLKVKVKGEDNIDGIEHALNTIWSQLSPQQKSLLQLRANEFGGEATPQTLIIEYLSTMRKKSKSITLDIEHTFNSGNAEARSKRLKDYTAEKDSTMEKLQMADAAVFLSGYGHVGEHRFSNGSRGNIIINGNDLPITKGNSNVGRVSLDYLQTTNFAGILDLRNASIGGNSIDATKLLYVLVDGGELVLAALPVDKKALAENKVRPDLEACTRLLMAWKEIRQAGVNEINAQNAEFINQVLSKHQLPAMFVGVSNGLPILAVTEYLYFGVLNGFVDGAALPEDGSFDATLLPLDENDAAIIQRQFKDKVKGYKGTRTGGFLGIGDHPALYSGTVFIPLKVDMNNAYSGSGIHPTVPQRENIARREIHKNMGPKDKTLDHYNVTYD